jgi:hypothetical protein
LNKIIVQAPSIPHFKELAMRICNMTKIICLNPTISKYPAKSDFFIRLQIFLYASYNFLPPEELPPHAKNDECVYIFIFKNLVKKTSQLAFFGNF